MDKITQDRTRGDRTGDDERGIADEFRATMARTADLVQKLTTLADRYDAMIRDDGGSAEDCRRRVALMRAAAEAGRRLLQASPAPGPGQAGASRHRADRPLQAWSSRGRPDVVVVRPPVEIDLVTERAFATAMTAACSSGARCVVVDFSAVTFCGLIGLDTLVGAAATLRTTGRRLEVRHAPPMLVRMARVTGTDRALGLVS